MERHKLDVLSLFAGIVFVVIAVVGLVDTVAISLTDLRWLGPAALVGFGVVLVMTAGSAVGRRGDGPPATGDDLGDDGPDRDVEGREPAGAASPTDGTPPADRVAPPDAASPSDE